MPGAFKKLYPFMWKRWQVASHEDEEKHTTDL
jgi:hypothetical protein